MSCQSANQRGWQDDCKVLTNQIMVSLSNYRQLGKDFAIVLEAAGVACRRK